MESSKQEVVEPVTAASNIHRARFGAGSPVPPSRSAFAFPTNVGALPAFGLVSLRPAHSASLIKPRQ